MNNINNYDKELSEDEISQGYHRGFVGGLWEELGQLQFDFLVNQGLKPNNTLCDIGCGCLRGGIHFVNYLNKEHYFGIDINQSLLNAAQLELRNAGIADKKPNLLCTDKFDITSFNNKFDYMLAVSVFTHIPMNNILQCLQQVKENLNTNGRFFATFFLSPNSIHTRALNHTPGGITTHYTKDPFHYSKEEIKKMASLSGLNVSFVEQGWNHPRAQSMVNFFL